MGQCDGQRPAFGRAERQDSSLTKTMAGLPLMVSGGPDVFTVCSGVITWPGLT
jgi:hypothetical protein